MDDESVVVIAHAGAGLVNWRMSAGCRAGHLYDAVMHPNPPVSIVPLRVSAGGSDSLNFDALGSNDSTSWKPFTLVVWLWLMDAPFGTSREARTPGLSEDECKAAAKLVQPPQGRAHCVLEGRPEPAWTPPASYTLNGSIYIGGGEHKSLRAHGLNESVCRTWAAEVRQAQGHASCDATGSPPVCADCRTLKERGRGPA